MPRQGLLLELTVNYRSSTGEQQLTNHRNLRPRDPPFYNPRHGQVTPGSGKPKQFGSGRSFGLYPENVTLAQVVPTAAYQDPPDPAINGFQNHYRNR
jgi:hypothetical protein